MWPPPTSLAGDFWIPFAVAGGFCCGVCVLSAHCSPRVFGTRYTNLSPAVQRLWHSYTYSLLPGVVISCMAFKDVQQQFGSRLLDADALLLTAPSTLLLQATGASLGFLSLDLLVMVFWRQWMTEAMGKPMYKQMIVHHLFCIVIWPQALMRNLGSGIVGYLLCTEFTSFFLNLRWLLIKAKLDSSPFFLVNGVLLFISFFVIRILPIPWYYWALLVSSKKGWTLYECIGCLCSAPIPPLLNAWWFYLIIRAAIRTVRPLLNGKTTNGVEGKAE